MRSLIALTALATLGATTTVQAQNPVTWKVASAKVSAAKGGQATIKLAATIEDGWYIYSVTQGPGGPFPTRITVSKEQPFTLGAAAKASVAPAKKFDENFGIEVETHRDKAEFSVPVKVESTAKTGAQEVEVAVRYQACDDSVCLPAKTVRVKAPITVTAK